MNTIQEQLTAIEEANNIGNFAEAESICRELLAQNLQYEERATTLLYITQSLYRRGLAKEALPFAQEYLSFAEKTENRELLAKSFHALGSIYRSLSDYSRALQYCHKALQIYEELGSKSGATANLSNIGGIYFQLSDYPRALEYVHQALTINEELANKNGIAINLANLAIIYSNLSDYQRAIEYYHQALAINEELGSKYGIAINLGNIGNVYKNLSDYTNGLEYYHRALSIKEELGDKSGIAINLSNIGNIYATRDFPGYDVAKAEKYLLQSLDLYQELNSKKELYEIYMSLACLYKQEARWKEYAEYLERYYDVRDEVQNEEAQKLSEKFAFERQIAVMEKEREVLESSSLEIMRAYSVIEAEKERSDALLLNILPHSIADRIKQGERMIADPFDSVSIFFADIVGFTDLSTKISATELITLLNTIFITMDRIATIYQIEKIKTIGDAYMAVSGLPVPNVNHASNMAIFAKSVLTEMKSLDSFIRSNIDMRIGIHCGPVVAGIIGEHKFSYDIWGDSVNTASRMESHGEPGKIHISEEFKNALAGYDEFSFTARKPMYIKGKGMMNTFFLS